MAHTVWQLPSHLSPTKSSGGEWDFFYAIWSLLQKHQRPLSELIRFQVQPELAFFGSDLIKVEQKNTQQGLQYRVSLNFIGLIGAQGVLPPYFREAALQQIHARNPSMLILLDWLQQRILQLAYEGWQKRRWFTQGLLSRQPTPLTSLLASLQGLSAKHAWQQDTNRLHLQYYAAHFANSRRPLGALQGILADVLQCPVKLLPMQGGWLPLAPGHATCLGGAATQSNLSSLGRNTALGSRIWCPQAKVLIQVGPIAEEQFTHLLPGADGYQHIQQLIARYVQQDYQWEMQLQLTNSAIQACRLGASAWNQLGQTSFLSAKRPDGINSDITLGVYPHESHPT